jgi:hypothetical protein
MKLRDLPQPIRELAEKRIREQGNEPDGENGIRAGKAVGGFNFITTPEGLNFWDKIAYGNFTPFYERYPKQSKQYTLEQLREEKIAVLVENEEQAKALGIDNWSKKHRPYLSISKKGIIDSDLWSFCDETFWRGLDFTIINFSQVILPEAKQEAGVGTNCTPPSNPHYKQTTIEPITVIQDWKLSFCLGNVIKYIGRADHKGDKLADLEKAADYLRMEIEQLKR